MSEPSKYTILCRDRAAKIHAKNRARIQREREDMARNWDGFTSEFDPVGFSHPSPEAAMAAVFREMGRDFGDPS